MKIIGWSGKWPTNEYDHLFYGKDIRYEFQKSHNSSKEVKESKVKMVLCGVEPMILMENGDQVSVTLDKIEICS